MASLTATRLSQVPFTLRGAGERILNALVWMAEQSPKYRAAQHYSAMTDAELAELGMTRADIVRRIYGPHSYM